MTDTPTKMDHPIRGVSQDKLSSTIQGFLDLVNESAREIAGQDAVVNAYNTVLTHLENRQLALQNFGFRDALATPYTQPIKNDIDKGVNGMIEKLESDAVEALSSILSLVRDKTAEFSLRGFDDREIKEMSLFERARARLETKGTEDVTMRQDTIQRVGPAHHNIGTGLQNSATNTPRQAADGERRADEEGREGRREGEDGGNGRDGEKDNRREGLVAVPEEIESGAAGRDGELTSHQQAVGEETRADPIQRGLQEASFRSGTEETQTDGGPNSQHNGPARAASCAVSRDSATATSKHPPGTTAPVPSTQVSDAPTCAGPSSAGIHETGPATNPLKRKAVGGEGEEGVSAGRRVTTWRELESCLRYTRRSAGQRG